MEPNFRRVFCVSGTPKEQLKRVDVLSLLLLLPSRKCFCLLFSCRYFLGLCLYCHCVKFTVSNYIQTGYKEFNVAASPKLKQVLAANGNFFIKSPQ